MKLSLRCQLLPGATPSRPTKEPNMIGTRTRYSLAQFLELQEPMMSVVLLSKYGVQHLSFRETSCCMGS